MKPKKRPAAATWPPALAARPEGDALARGLWRAARREYAAANGINYSPADEIAAERAARKEMQ